MTASANQHSELDIGKQQIGAVYAKALLATTEKDQSSEAVLDELDALVDQLLGQFPQLEAVLASPRVSAEEKAQILDRTLAGRVSEQLLRFLKVVGRHNRLDCLRQIRRAARQQLNQLRGRLEVQVTTPEPLQEAQRKQITQALQEKLGQEVYLQSRVDPSILGGLIVRIGDTVFDSSVANRLTRLRRETIEHTIQKLRDSADRFAVSG